MGFGKNLELADWLSRPPGGYRVSRSKIRKALLKHSDQFVRTMTEKLLTYALGRGLEYYDMPVVRAIEKDAAKQHYRFSSLVTGIVNSVPFRMKKAQEFKDE